MLFRPGSGRGVVMILLLYCTTSSALGSTLVVESWSGFVRWIRGPESSAAQAVLAESCATSPLPKLFGGADKTFPRRLRIILCVSSFCSQKQSQPITQTEILSFQKTKSTVMTILKKDNKKRLLIIGTVVCVIAIAAIIGGTVGAKSLRGSSNSDASKIESPVEQPPSPPENNLVPPPPGAPPTLPVIAGFLFRGYNLLKGNPNPTGDSTSDPGFQEPIFASTYASQGTTGDLRYSVPDGISVTTFLSCSLDFSSTIMESVSQYSEKLSQTAMVSGSATSWGVTASFSASADYEQVTEEVVSSLSTAVHSEARCSTYESSINSFTPPPFSSNFLAALQTLPEDYEEQPEAYSIFLDAFGTHYVTDTTMGAIYGEQSFISESNRKLFESDSLSLEASASLSGFGASIEASGGQSTMTEDLQMFREVAENRQAFTQGSRPPLEGGATAWANSAIENPAPIAITLARIDSIHGLAQAAGSEAVVENIGRAIDDFCTMATIEGTVATCTPTEFNFSEFTVPTDRDGSVVTDDDARGDLIAPVVCNDGAFLTSIDFLEREGVGFVDAVLACSDGVNKTAVGTTSEDRISAASCPNGFDSFRDFGQIHCCNTLAGEYNVVGMEVSCKDDIDENFIGYFPGGSNPGAAEAVFCGFDEHIVGIQFALARNSNRGIARLRLVCMSL